MPAGTVRFMAPVFGLVRVWVEEIGHVASYRPGRFFGLIRRQGPGAYLTDVRIDKMPIIFSHTPVLSPEA
jgi:hypothetical protein